MWSFALTAIGWLWSNREAIIAGVQKYGPVAVSAIETYGPMVREVFDKAAPSIEAQRAQGVSLEEAILKFAASHLIVALTPHRMTFEEEQRWMANTDQKIG